MQSIPRFPELERDYEIVRELGRGGTAVVYLARDRELNRDVAIKVVRPGYANDPQAVARLEREARLIAALRHPNIVKLLATRRLSDGSLALIIEYVPGPNLKTALRNAGPAPFDVVRLVLWDVGKALDYAHRRHGIVHRDIKPDNIYLDPDQHIALLADFGIARNQAGDQEITIVGSTLGTPAYMSPEQIDGGELDGRSDLYSLGLVAYEMLTGQPPWAGLNLYSIIYKQKHEELPPIRTVRPDTPEDLLLVIDGLLQKDPAARWSSAAAFLSQLGGVEGARAAQASLTAWPAVAAASEVAEPEAPVDQPTLEFVPDAAGSHPSPQSGATTAGVGGGDISGAVQADVVDPPIVDEAFVAAAGAVNAATTAPGVDAPFPGGTGVPPTGAAWTRGYGRRPPPTRKPADQSRRRVLITVGVVLMVIAAGFVATIMGRLGPDQGTEDVAGDVVAGGTTGIPAGGSTGVSTGDDETGSGVPESPGATLAAVDSASLAALLQGAAGSPARVVRIGGDAQVGTTGSALPIPLQVRVEDEMGRPVPGVPVRFSAVAGGGAVDPVVAVTDANGVASASLTLGREIGEQRVTAMIEPPAEGTAPASAVYSATFFAAALASGPASLVRVGSNIISAEPGSEVAGGIAVRVVDDTGVGVAGVVVEFTVTAGNGVVLPAQVQTDTAGIARASWTLGPEPGVHSVMASVPSAGLVLPIVVTAADRFVARATIVAGGTYSCALDAAGAVACWGANEAGQIGDGTTQRRAAPAAVRSQTRFSTIATGFSHTCGIGADGRAYCWGSNANGQLGDGTRVNRSSPVPVDAATRFTRVTAGLAHTCALTADGLAYCWGSNANGRLGDDSTTDWEWPARVSSNTAFSDITAGWTHTCAVTPAGFAYCWGGNSHGQIGDGSVADRRTPTAVSGGHRFRQLSAGANHTCGVTTDGEVLCWGRNHFGQLGDGTGADRAAPAPIASELAFTTVTTGAHHACALTTDGQAYCWGHNAFGQLGNGGTANALTPVPVAGGLRFSTLHATGSHTCGRTTAGADYCWGYNVEGQLGDGARTDRREPVRVTGGAGAWLTPSPDAHESYLALLDRGAAAAGGSSTTAAMQLGSSVEED